MAKVADVEIELRAQVSGLQGDLSKAQRQLEGFARSSGGAFRSLGQDIERSFSRFLSPAGLVAGVGAMGTAFAVATKKALDFASDIVDTARSIGISTSALQELRFAATQTGVDVEVLDGALSKLTKSAGGALAERTGDAAEAFRRLGISLADVEKSSPEELFTRVVSRLGEISSAFDRSKLSSALLGKSFVEIGKLATEGADGIDALRQQARDLGLVIGDDVLKAAEKAGDKFDALFNVLKIQGVQAILTLTPELSSLADWLVKATKASEDFFDSLRDPKNRTSFDGINTGIDTLTIKIQNLQNQLNNIARSNPPGSKLREQAQPRIDALQAEIGEMIKERDALEESRPIQGPQQREVRVPGSSTALPGIDKAAASKAARGAAKEAAQLAREAEQQSDRIANSLQDESRMIASLAEDRLQAEAALADAVGDTALAEEKRTEAIEARFERERALIVETVQDAEASQRAIADLTATRNAQLAIVAKKADDSFAHLKQFGIDGISDALADLAISGKLTFETLAQSFLREFIQVAIKQGVAKLAESLAEIKLGSEASSAGGGIGSLFSLFGFASGGIVTRPTIGMIGEAGPEAVIPLDQLNSGGGNVEVIINNNGGGQARLTQEQRSGRDVRLMFEIVDAEFADRASRGGSKFVRTLTQNFGLQRRGERNG